MIDLATELGTRAQQRLKEDYFVWLTTVDSAGVPQPNPVWFYWDGKMLLVYSQFSARRVKNIETNSRVSVNFQADADGEDFIVLTGLAAMEHSATGADTRYIQKYRDLISKFEFTPETLAKSYNTTIRIRPTSLRGL